MRKLADLLPDVDLQEHQQNLVDQAKKEPLRKLLVHALGSGKTLSSIAASEAQGNPYTAVVPASLRSNFKTEQAKFTDQKTPSDVMSYTQLGAGKPVMKTDSLVFDESHRLRNPDTLASHKAMELANKAKQILLLSGQPIVNNPSDLAVPISMLTGKKLTPEEFDRRYVGGKPVNPNILQRLIGIKPGEEPSIKNEDELKALLKGHVDWYAPDKSVVPTNYEDIPVEMGREQGQLYNAMWDKLPWYLRWKLKHDFPLSSNELRRATSFLTGPRQVGLSTYPYMGTKDPMKAFEQSPKLQSAMGKLQEKLKDERTKALIFSNFIDAGLTPYSAALQKANIPHGIFHGGLSDKQRQQLVNDYNTGKIRAALLGPSGSEGLSFKGTQLIQLLDPYWNQGRGKQSVGRGLRFDSHEDLPEELQNVHVQRFMSRLPLGFTDRMLNRIGWDNKPEPGADEHLMTMAKRKDELNQKFMNLLQQVGQRK